MDFKKIYSKYKGSGLGFTVIELLVGISLFSILSLIGILNYSKISFSYKKFDALSQVTEDLRIAQQQTVSEGGRGIFVIAADGKSYSFGYDYLPYNLTEPIVPDSILWSNNLPKLITVESTDLIIFNSQGRVVDKDGVIISPTLTFKDTYDSAENIFRTGELSSNGIFSLN